MAHPDLILPPHQLEALRTLDPVYPATEGISSRMLGRWIRQLLADLPEAPEWLYGSTVQHHHWPSPSQALRQLHRPASQEQAREARARLAYDEAFAHQLSLLRLRQQQQRYPGLKLALLAHPDVAKAFEKLPFTLTEGQRDVLAHMERDMQSGERMLRLLQGDVGSGKTVVAALAMLAAVRQGYQAAMMAPTEMLARQHLQALAHLLGLLEVPVIFLAGSLTPRQREAALARIRSCPQAVIVGTHALFQESVAFANLALIVIDEQHRFGVNQRLALNDKGSGPAGTQPHMLLMTATPIPRSLQLTQYGDLDISLLTQKPAGRQPIETRVVAHDKLRDLIEAAHRAIQAGEKIYWICPLVEEPETSAAGAGPRAGGSATPAPLQTAQARYDGLALCFPGKVGLVHGKMPMDQRDPVMQAFKRGSLRLLVATTVVEVGVDVPDATIMIIENAERFGLAQLHQLRGRVGRGEKPSRCILLYQPQCSQTARQRLKTMRETQDGFVIAEADLLLRGGGDVLGTRQTGLPEFTFLDLQDSTAPLQAARQESAMRLKEDPELHRGGKGQACRALLRLFEHRQAASFVQSG